ncbi:hypothetical protein GYMLUDRAFT_82524 [Collybiopsis luxurians FD-317 M1]|nr:hypothetical protein GYMLUDRAFT_82524 [Collybiopsis luxurians FD-317 M1]
MSSNSSGCPSIPTSQVLVDDTDSRVVYSGSWVKEGLAGIECRGTTHGSSNGTAEFTFNGVAIQVYGTIGSKNGSNTTSSYQVDDLPSYTLNFKGDGTTHHHLRFYSSPTLESGSHKLAISVPARKGNEIFLDYIIYNSSLPSSTNVSPSPSTPSGSASVITGNTASKTPQALTNNIRSTVASASKNTTTLFAPSHGSFASLTTSSLAVPSSPSSSTILSSPTAINSRSKPASHSIGTIVGGVVGGIMGLALVILAMRKYVRWVARITERSKIQPFPLASPTSPEILTENLPFVDTGAAADKKAMSSAEPCTKMPRPRKLLLEPILSAMRDIPPPYDAV